MLKRVSRKQPVGQEDVLQVIFLSLFVRALICQHHGLPPPPSPPSYLQECVYKDIKQGELQTQVVSWRTSGLSSTDKA